MEYLDQLYYLVKKYNQGEYDTDTFADEFHRIFDVEMDLSVLSNKELELFGRLSTVAGRYSKYEEDLKIPNMYFSSEDVQRQVKKIIEELEVNDRI